MLQCQKTERTGYVGLGCFFLFWTAFIVPIDVFVAEPIWRQGATSSLNASDFFNFTDRETEMEALKTRILTEVGREDLS